MSARAQLPVITIPDESVPNFVLKRCSEHDNAVAMIDNHCGGKSLTFREIYDQSRSCAAFLHNNGVTSGDFVGLCAPNSFDYPIAMLGIMACGATVCPCNPDYKPGEILHVFKISEPKIAFVHETSVETMKKVQAELPCLQTIFVIGKSKEYVTLDMMKNCETEKDCLDTIEINPNEDFAMLPHSSGTTGTPKVVLFTHKSLLTSILSFHVASQYKTTDCYYTDRPMFHSLGAEIALANLAHGVKLLFERVFSQVDEMLEAVQKYKVTHIWTAPHMMQRLVREGKSPEWDTSSLREVACGGATLAPNVVHQLSEDFNVKVVLAYGMTEFGRISVNRHTGIYPASVGKVVTCAELKIIDLNTAEELSTDQVGEILVRGPQGSKGYFKNPEATALTIDKCGWFHTGDIGRKDKDGMLYVTGRLKEAIKFSGVQIPPVEIENTLLKHPKVADVGVIGIPHPEHGEVPKAFIIARDISLTKQEVHTFVRGELVDYKQLRGGIEFVEAIPRNASGKIQRQELKKMAGLY